MQSFRIDVSDCVADKILWFLQNFNNVKVEKIDLEDEYISKDIDLKSLEELQEDSMSNTWDNKEDENWNNYV